MAPSDVLELGMQIAELHHVELVGRRADAHRFEMVRGGYSSGTGTALGGWRWHVPTK